MFNFHPCGNRYLASPFDCRSKISNSLLENKSCFNLEPNGQKGQLLTHLLPLDSIRNNHKCSESRNRGDWILYI